ncbi:MAG: VOC family protein [Chloroflexi bacterium]|nr:MAG: VOC family protein [Chloroflexota bacterium]
MPDFTQSPENLDPPTVVDHVLLPVADLEDGAQKLREQYGLEAIPGGRHPKVGTANMIVPLGRQYLELIAIADPQEAAASRLGRRVTLALAEGRMFVGWAVRTGSMDAMRGKLLAAGWDLPPIGEGSRRRPDGQVLRWRTQDLDTGAAPIALPFVIEWDVPDGLHPGQAAASHPSGAKALRRVVVGARNPEHVREQLQLLLGDSDLYQVREAALDGVEEVVLDAPHWDLVIRTLGRAETT